MADNVRLVTFNGENVTPQDDALYHQTAIDTNGIIYGCGITATGANTIRVAEGFGIICGRFFEVFEHVITVPLSAYGEINGRVIAHLDLSNTDEPFTIVAQTGALPALIQEDDVNIFNGVYEILLATFKINATTIRELKDVKPMVSGFRESIYEELDEVRQETLGDVQWLINNSLVNRTVTTFNGFVSALAAAKRAGTEDFLPVFVDVGGTLANKLFKDSNLRGYVVAWCAYYNSANDYAIYYFGEAYSSGGGFVRGTIRDGTVEEVFTTFSAITRKSLTAASTNITAGNTADVYINTGIDLNAYTVAAITDVRSNKKNLVVLGYNYDLSNNRVRLTLQNIGTTDITGAAPTCTVVAAKHDLM